MTAAPLPAHPAAALLPSMSEDEYAELLADVKANGLRSPIVLLDGQVLDGRHRLRACTEAEVEPLFEDFTGDDPVSFVLAMNVKRRHLTASQRAAVAVDAEPLFAEAAKERQRKSGGNRKGGTSVSADLHQPVTGKGKALAQAATATGASHRSAANAKKVKDADPAAFEQIRTGAVTVDKATKDVTQRAAYRDAIAEFPFLGPEQSPGVPKSEVVDIAVGLRTFPEGPERDQRIDAAKRWHRRYSPEATERREAREGAADAYKAAAKAMEAVDTLNIVIGRRGALDTFDSLDLSEFERDLWHGSVLSAIESLTAIAAALEPKKMRRVK